jgi:hypothetical protein
MSKKTEQSVGFCKQEQRGRSAQQRATRWGKLVKEGQQLKETWIQQTILSKALQVSPGPN